jgi:hydrogenase nickel incorporation protein HypA/HybF
MHELGVATQIAGVVRRVMQEHSAEKVGEVTVEIGALAGIDEPSLEFCFEAITTGTELAGAHLKIEMKVPKARCRKCDCEYTVDISDFRCKCCGSSDFDLESAADISVLQMEVE